MIMYSFLRAVKFALQNLWRNIGLSFMTVSILVVAVLSLNVVIGLNAMAHYAVSTVREQVDVSIYFSPEATDNQVQEVLEFLGRFPEVKEAMLKSREDALSEFRARYQDNPEVIASLEELEDNPLGPTIVVRTYQPGQYRIVLGALDTPQLNTLIEGKTYDDHQEFIERLELITNRAGQFMVGLTGLFAVIAFLIIFNTIRVAIYTQREEISIKKLVGASNWFIRAPFLLDGVAYTVLGVGTAGVIVGVALWFFDGYVQAVFVGFSLREYFLQNWPLAAYQFICVLLLTWLSSGLAMRKYLRA